MRVACNSTRPRRDARSRRFHKFVTNCLGRDGLRDIFGELCIVRGEPPMTDRFRYNIVLTLLVDYDTYTQVKLCSRPGTLQTSAVSTACSFKSMEYRREELRRLPSCRRQTLGQQHLCVAKHRFCCPWNV